MNEAWKARKRLKAIQHEMEASLVTSYKDSPGNVELARYMQKLMLVNVMKDLITQAVEFCYLHHL